MQCTQFELCVNMCFTFATWTLIRAGISEWIMTLHNHVWNKERKILTFSLFPQFIKLMWCRPNRNTVAFNEPSPLVTRPHTMQCRHYGLHLICTRIWNYSIDPRLTSLKYCQTSIYRKKSTNIFHVTRYDHSTVSSSSIPKVWLS